MEDSPRIFLYRFLPEPVQDFFLDSGLDDIRLIADQYGLSGEAEDILDQIQQEVLFGYETVDKVPNLIRTRLGYDQGQATRIALTLIEKRFLPIDSYLQTMAFRTFTSLGGNTNVAQIQKVETGGATVRETREELDQYLAVQAVLQDEADEAGDDQTDEVNTDEAPEEATPEVSAEASSVEVEKAPEPVPVEPPPVAEPESEEDEDDDEEADPRTAAQMRAHIRQAADESQDEREEAIAAMKAFDAVQDKNEPERVGEPIPPTAPEPVPEPPRAEPVVERQKPETEPELDPEHELAPPPPVLVEEEAPKKKKKNRRRKRKKKAASVPEVVVETSVKEPAQKAAPQKEVPVKGAEEASNKEVEKTVPPASQTVSAAPPKETVVAAKPHVAKPRNSILDVEHEAEVAQMMQKLKETGMQAPRGLEHAKIDDVKRRLSLTFPSMELEKRFRVLVGARLSGVRSRQDVAAALTREVSKGGMGFDEHTRDRVIEDVEAHLDETAKQATQQVEEQKQAYVASQQKQYGDRATSEVVVTPAPVVAAPAPPTPKKATTKPVLSEASVQKKSAGPANKPPVADVKYERRLVGPIEELRRMNVEDFRRLPGDAQDALTAIREDIENMGHQDPGLRVRAIEGWRASPLVATYQRVLSAALHEGVPVDKVLDDAAKNPAELTKEEFQAIHALNMQLRY